METELARQIGPLARVVVKRAAKGAGTLADLVAKLELEIDSDEARRAFREAMRSGSARRLGSDAGEAAFRRPEETALRMDHDARVDLDLFVPVIVKPEPGLVLVALPSLLSSSLHFLPRMTADPFSGGRTSGLSRRRVGLWVLVERSLPVPRRGRLGRRHRPRGPTDTVSWFESLSSTDLSGSPL